MHIKAVPGRKSAVLPLFLLVSTALLGGCGAAPESVEDGAEEDVSMETQAARAVDQESQPADEIASESTQLQDVDDIGDLPVDNDPLTETDSKMTCLADCARSTRPEACKEICYCLYPNAPRPESTYDCVKDVIIKLPY